MKPHYFFWICEISHIWVQQSRFSAPKQWATFQISYVDLYPKSAKCKISTNFLIGFKPRIFSCRGINYHTRSCSGHDTVIINIGQAFKFIVCNSAPIFHFSKRSEDPARHSKHSPTDISEFGYQLSVGSLWHNHIVMLPQWTKTSLSSRRNRQDGPIGIVPSTILPFPERRIQNACGIGLSRSNRAQ